MANVRGNRITVIIPTYNRVDALERTLRVMFDVSEVFPDEILVVDQTQEAHKAQAIKEVCAKYDLVRLLRLESPSITAARNVGLDNAVGEIILYMDDDVDVKAETIRNIYRLFEEPGLAMIAGINEDDMKNPKPSKLGMLFGRSSYRRLHTGHVTKAVYGRFPCSFDTPVATEWAMGFFFAVRKSVVDKYHLRFDENLKFYAYAEDLDFTYRLWKCADKESMTTLVTPEIIVKHNVSKEYRTPKRSATYMTVLHRRYLSHKLFGTLSSRLWALWSDLGSILAAKVLSKEARNIMSAQIFSLKHYKDIKRGDFHYADFM